MSHSESHLERLQNLLRELFQFDLADLDFGLYRLLHLKRDEVEKFLSEQLPRQVDEAFVTAAHVERETLESDLKRKATEVRQTIGSNAILDNGEPHPQYADANVVKSTSTSAAGCGPSR